ncbi:MAG: transcription antitermination factor NusB [Eubacterium sp.]|nr:transcription antitermination factor NusB [Eubacterium sp.]
MTRHEIRECMFCLLFQNEFYGTDEFAEQRDNFLEQKSITEKEKNELLSKMEKLLSFLPDIDGQIEANSKGWKLDRIAKAELAILRLAVFEAKYDDTIPVGVAVNEAVELAKAYGGDNAPAFVNGILGKIVNE